MHLSLILLQMVHNRIVEVLGFFTMFKHNLESSTELLRQLAKTDKRLPYRQPEVCSLGTLEQIQARYQGSTFDGPDKSYWYSSSN